MIAGYYTAKYKLIVRLRPLAAFLLPTALWGNYYFGTKVAEYVNNVNLCDCQYPAAPYLYMAAFMGIAALCLCASIFKRSRFWQYCGRNSLSMFAAQTFVIYLVVEILGKWTNQTYTPMHGIGDLLSFAIGTVSFLLLFLLTYPWNFVVKSCKKIWALFLSFILKLVN